MADRNSGAHLLRKLVLAGLVVAGALSVLGCDAIVDTKGRPACTTNSECTSRFGEPSMCVESACTKLLSPECTEVWPPNALSQDNTILIGYLGQLAGTQKYGEPPMQGMKLALKEIETDYNGFPGASADSPRRHLAMLVCDHGADPDMVARHLIQDAKVPVIVGASFSGTTLTVFDDVAGPANVMMLSPSATSPALTTLADKGLLWRTAPSDVVQAELLKYLKVDVEDLLHDQKTLAVGAPATVVMPTKDDSAGQGLANAARSPVTPMPGQAPGISKGLVAIVYDDPDKNPNVNWDKLSQDTINANPDIILAMGTGEFVSHMLPKIEAGWDEGKKRRPWYVLPEGDRDPALIKDATDIGTPNYPLNQRVIGAAPGARKADLYKFFRGRFLPLFDNHEPGNLAEFGYDAGYLLLYAIAIAKKDAPTGPELANAMKFMSCKDGPVVPAGPEDNTDPNSESYFSTAVEHGCIDFDGASGPLDFNPDTGEAVSDIAMWCLHPTSAGSFSFEPTLDSYYSVQTNSVAVTDGGTPLNLKEQWCAPSQ